MRKGAAIGALGVTIGCIASLALARALGSVLYGIPAHDLPTLAGVAALLLATVLVACLVPARRACATAPRDALA